MGYTEILYSPYATAEERKNGLIRPGDRVAVRNGCGEIHRYIIVPETGLVRFRVSLFGQDCVAEAGDSEEGMEICGFTVASVAFPLGRELCEVAEGERYLRRCIPPELAETCEVRRVERNPDKCFDYISPPVVSLPSANL